MSEYKEQITKVYSEIKFAKYSLSSLGVKSEISREAIKEAIMEHLLETWRSEETSKEPTFRELEDVMTELDYLS